MGNTDGLIYCFLHEGSVDLGENVVSIHSTVIFVVHQEYFPLLVGQVPGPHGPGTSESLWEPCALFSGYPTTDADHQDLAFEYSPYLCASFSIPLGFHVILEYDLTGVR